MDGVLQHMRHAVDHALLFALGQLGADSRGGEERANARAGGADALGQRALGNELQFQLARPVQIIKRIGARLAWERAHHLAHLAAQHQLADAHAAAACVVADDGEVFGALGHQRVDQVGGQACAAKTRNHHARAVWDVSHGLGQAGDDLVDHGITARA